LQKSDAERGSNVVPLTHIIDPLEDAIEAVGKIDGYMVGKTGGKIGKHQGNIELALQRMGVSLSYNRMSSTVLIDESPIHEDLVDDLWFRMHREEGINPPNDYFNKFLGYLGRKNSFHPVCDWMVEQEWDGKERVDHWLQMWCGVEDNEYARASGRLFLLAACKRILEPGCKYDELLVLEGKQGIRKSTFLKTLAIRPEWFSDSLPLNASAQQVIEQTSGFWIIEYAEMQGIKQTRWEQMKAMLSRQTDVSRLAWGRQVTRRDRQWVAAGTTNAEIYLSDPSGNRRNRGVGCKIDSLDVEGLRAALGPLWAEAWGIAKRGCSLVMPASAAKMAAVEQEKRMLDDDVYATLSGGLGEIEAGKIRRDDVWKLLGVEGIKQKTELTARMSHAMQRLGWERGADNGRIVWGRKEKKRVQGFVIGEVGPREERPHVGVNEWGDVEVID